MNLMKVRRALVIGCGEFGAAVADALSDAGFSVTVIDKTASAFNALSAGFGGERVTDDGANVAVLEDCEIGKAELLVACTERDSVNYFVARVASEVYGVEHVFARIEDEDLVAMLEDSVVEPICPHVLCLGEFRRRAKIG